jgi:hypothetical protein
LPKLKQMWLQKSWKKTVFCWHGFVHCESLPECQTIKAMYQKRYWTPLKKNELSYADPDPINNSFFMHNSSPSCNVAIMGSFRAKRMVAILHYPPYLPHLTPVDDRLFPKLRFNLKGLHLQFTTEIQDAVTRVLYSIWKEAFLEGTTKRSMNVQVHL